MTTRTLLALTLALTLSAAAAQGDDYQWLLRGENAFTKFDCTRIADVDPERVGCYMVSADMELTRLYLQRVILSTSAEWITAWAYSETSEHMMNRAFEWSGMTHFVLILDTRANPITLMLIPPESDPPAAEGSR